MNAEEVLKELCLAPAPSGYEKRAAEVFSSRIRPFVDRIMLDRMGNVMATLDGTDPESPSVMMYAHLDQLGFIVRRIEPDGYIQLDRLGGIPEKVLPALRLWIRTVPGDFIPGLIGNKAHHAASAEEKYKVDMVTNLYVDIGAASEQEVRALGVDVGCPAIYEPSFQPLAGDKVSGTALDDRGGLTALILAAESLWEDRPSSTVHFVGTVWEEFNIRGAAFAARRLKPEVAMGLDVVLAGDTPDLKTKYQNALGKGPTINFYNFHGRGTLNGMIPHEGLARLAEECALRENIPHQRFASLGIITESAYVQMENEGVACLDLGYPARYTHSPVETCSLSDIKNLGLLAAASAKAITPEFSINRYSIDCCSDS